MLSYQIQVEDVKSIQYVLHDRQTRFTEEKFFVLKVMEVRMVR